MLIGSLAGVTGAVAGKVSNGLAKDITNEYGKVAVKVVAGGMNGSIVGAEV